MLRDSILNSTAALAADEGQATALDVLQDWQIALESITEVGDAIERSLAAALLQRVNAAITAILHAASPA